jgi:hypothetical protein
MHFIVLIKHEDNVAENDRQTQLSTERKCATGKAELHSGPRQKGEGFGHK